MHRDFQWFDTQLPSLVPDGSVDTDGYDVSTSGAEGRQSSEGTGDPGTGVQMGTQDVPGSSWTVSNRLLYPYPIQVSYFRAPRQEVLGMR